MRTQLFHDGGSSHRMASKAGRMDLMLLHWEQTKTEHTDLGQEMTNGEREPKKT